MDELYLLAALRYVVMYPVKEKMVAQTSDWAWSSTKAHLSGKDYGQVSVRPLLDRVDNVSDFLVATPEQELEFALEKGRYSFQLPPEIARSQGRQLRDLDSLGPRKKYNIPSRAPIPAIFERSSIAKSSH